MDKQQTVAVFSGIDGSELLAVEIVGPTKVLTYRGQTVEASLEAVEAIEETLIEILTQMNALHEQNQVLKGEVPPLTTPEAPS